MWAAQLLGWKMASWYDKYGWWLLHANLKYLKKRKNQAGAGKWFWCVCVNGELATGSRLLCWMKGCEDFFCQDFTELQACVVMESK